MSDVEQEFTMTLANSSHEKADWLILWDAGTSDPITMLARTFGAISVPFKPHYAIRCNGAKAEASSPSILAIYDGEKIDVLSAFGETPKD